MTHRFWLPIALLALMAGTAQAQVGPSPGHASTGYRPTGYGPRQAQARTSPAQRSGIEAAQKLKSGMDKLLEYLAKKDTPNKLQAAAFLDREIAPYFDFAYMSQWVAGPSWAGMSEQDRKAMTAEIESSFLTTLASRMTSYNGQKVRYLRPRPGPNGSVKVPVGIVRPGTYPTRMTFRMYRSADGWKVYDVEANGRSAAAYYRTKLARSAHAVRAPGGQAVPAR
jgi:phospholipid transport system substrate-binding protein